MAAGDEASLEGRDHGCGARLRGGIDRLAVFRRHAGCGDRSPQRPLQAYDLAHSVMANTQLAVRLEIEPGLIADDIEGIEQRRAPPARRQPRRPRTVSTYATSARRSLRRRLRNAAAGQTHGRQDEHGLHEFPLFPLRPRRGIGSHSSSPDGSIIGSVADGLPRPVPI